MPWRQTYDGEATGVCTVAGKREVRRDGKVGILGWRRREKDGETHELDPVRGPGVLSFRQPHEMGKDMRLRETGHLAMRLRSRIAGMR